MFVRNLVSKEEDEEPEGASGDIMQSPASSLIPHDESHHDLVAASPYQMLFNRIDPSLALSAMAWIVTFSQEEMRHTLPHPPQGIYTTKSEAPKSMHDAAWTEELRNAERSRWTGRVGWLHELRAVRLSK